MTASALRRMAVFEARGRETPFYAIDVDGVREQARKVMSAWSRYFERFRLAYSYKTNPLAIIAASLRGLGAAAEVVSGAELRLALADGYTGREIIFGGPVKTEVELREAAVLGATLQIDSLDEVADLCRVVRDSRQPVPPACMLRMATLRAGEWSRFGLLPQEYPAAMEALLSAGVRVVGIHIHIGSNISIPAAYAGVVGMYVPLLRDLLERSAPAGAVILDVGGGFAAATFAEGGCPPPAEEYAAAVAGALRQARLDGSRIELMIEPGRCLVEDFGVLVSRVIVRKLRGERALLVVDAGSNLVRSAASWYHPVELIEEAPSEEMRRHDIVGCLCFEQDVIARDVLGSCSVAPGSLVLVGGAGGYDIPSANAWTRPAPAIVALLDGESVEVRRAQAIEEMRALEVPRSGSGSG